MAEFMQYWKHGSGHIGRIGFGSFGFCSMHHTGSTGFGRIDFAYLSLVRIGFDSVSFGIVGFSRFGRFGRFVFLLAGLTYEAPALATLALAYIMSSSICKPKLLYIVPILILTNTVEFNWKQ